MSVKLFSHMKQYEIISIGTGKCYGWTGTRQGVLYAQVVNSLILKINAFVIIISHESEDIKTQT